MLTEYIEAAMRHAKYEIFPGDNTFYGEIGECKGVWANEATLEECREDLRSALEDWLLFSLTKQLRNPVACQNDPLLPVWRPCSRRCTTSSPASRNARTVAHRNSHDGQKFHAAGLAKGRTSSLASAEA